MKKKGLWLGLLAVLLLWPVATVFADGPHLSYDDGQIFVDEDVSLEVGETFNDDLGVFDGDLTVPAGSAVNGDVFVTNGDVEIAGQVNGNVAVINGNFDLAQGGQVQGDLFDMSGKVEVAGRVRGDLSAMFGDVELKSSAVLEGDLTVLSGTLEREAGARVYGEEIPNIPLPKIPLIPEKPSVPERPEVPDVPRITPPVPHRVLHDTPVQWLGRFVGRVVSAGFFSLVWIALGVLVVFLWPRPTRRVADCIAKLPLQSFGLGLLTFGIAAVLEALAAVLMIVIILLAAALISTVILIPIGLLLLLFAVLVLLPVPLVLAGAMGLGWVSLAELVGRKVAHLLKAGEIKPLGATFLGLLITVALAAVLWVLKPVCCAWPFVILLTSVGLGAVIHTRFGRQPCRQATPSPSAEAEPLPAEAMDEEAGEPDVPKVGAG